MCWQHSPDGWADTVHDEGGQPPKIIERAEQRIGGVAGARGHFVMEDAAIIAPHDRSCFEASEFQRFGEAENTPARAMLLMMGPRHS